MLRIGKFAAFCVHVAHGEVVVTMDALQWAAPANFNGGTGGHSLCMHPILQARAEILIRLRHRWGCRHQQSLSADGSISPSFCSVLTNSNVSRSESSSAPSYSSHRACAMSRTLVFPSKRFQMKPPTSLN